MYKPPLKKSIKKKINRIRQGRLGFFPINKLLTGFPRIDECFEKGNLIILTGSPKVGKTSFALTIARNLAVEGDKSIGYISLDLAEEKVISRLISLESEIPFWRIKFGIVHDEEIPLIESKTQNLSHAQIYIKDIASPTINEIRVVSKRLLQVQKIDFLIIDFLQLIYHKNESTPRQVTADIKRLKDLAVELKIPILLLVDLEDDITHFPVLRTLRRLGNLEKYSDSILYLNHKEYHGENKTEVCIEKSKNGRPGMTEVYYDSSAMKFKLFEFVQDA